MLKYIFILLASLSCFAQTDSIASQDISVISAEKLNIVYRGIDNPIKIAVPGAVSFTATAPGLRPDETKGAGNYILNPGSGTEVIVNILAVMPDGVSKVERKRFRILGLPAPGGVIKGQSYHSELKMTKKELIDGIVSVDFENFFFEVKFEVFAFSIKNISKRKIITVDGNKMNEEAITFINKQRKGSVLLINEIKYGYPSVCLPRKAYAFSIELTD